jgi:hypothetical protein
MFYKSPYSDNSLEGNREQLQSMIIIKDEEISHLNHLLAKQAQEKDLEIQKLTSLLYEKNIEREKMIESMKTNNKVFNKTYKENRDFIISQYENIIKSKADIWDKRQKIINKFSQDDCKEPLKTDLIDRNCSPINTQVSQATSPLTLQFTKQCFNVLNSGREFKKPKPQTFAKKRVPLFSPISHRTRKSNKDDN